MENVLERALKKGELDQKGFREEVDFLAGQAYAMLLRYNGLVPEELQYWSDSGIVPIYAYKGTNEDIVEKLGVPEDYADCFVLCEESLDNGETRWSLYYETEIFETPISITLMYICTREEVENL